MIKCFLRIRENKMQRVLITTVLSLVFIGCAFLFTGNELLQNKRYQLRYYKQQQAILTKELAADIQDRLERKEKESVLLSSLEKSAINGSFRFVFLVKNHQLLQAKDENFYHDMQMKKITAEDKWNSYLRKKDQIVTVESFSYHEDTYVVGVASDRQQVLLNQKITKHSTYIMMVLAVVCMVFFVMLLGMVLVLNKNQRKLDKALNELKTSNHNLEDMSEQILYEEDKITQRNWYNSSNYDDELLMALLKKSDRKELFPMSFVYMKCYLNDRYFKKYIFQECKEALKKCLNSSQILLEISKGEFVALLYRTNEGKAAETSKILNNELKKRMNCYDVSVLTYVKSYADCYDCVSVEEEFVKIRKHMNEVELDTLEKIMRETDGMIHELKRSGKSRVKQ